MLFRSHWQDLKAAGVRVAASLPVGNLLLRPFVGRIDLRNHRKILVVDGERAFTGGMNIRAKHAPAQRQVLLLKLFLQGDGVRRDHELPRLVNRVDDAGQQVGERLAHTGARLEQQRCVVAQRRGDSKPEGRREARCLGA